MIGQYRSGSTETANEITAAGTFVVANVLRCPNGHATIKAVPIVYGLIEMTPERIEKEKNYNVAYGGCVVDSRGKQKFVCTTCGCSTYEKVGPTADGKPIWYDKQTKVIPAGKAITVTK
jgi:hypothetical protein